MQKYVSVETVHAFRIKEVVLFDGWKTGTLLGAKKRDMVTLPTLWFHTAKPSAGGYLIKHKDGTMSFLSSKAFKQRYKGVHPPTPEEK